MYFEEGLAVGWASVCDGRLLYFFLYTCACALVYITDVKQLTRTTAAQKLNFLRVNV